MAQVLIQCPALMSNLTGLSFVTMELAASGHAQVVGAIFEGSDPKMSLGPQSAARAGTRSVLHLLLACVAHPRGRGDNAVFSRKVQRSLVLTRLQDPE